MSKYLKNITNLSEDQKVLLISPKTPRFVSAPSTPVRPPPHPLIASLESSPEYHSPATSGSPPECGKSVRNRKNRTVIRQLILQAEAITNEDDSGEVDSSEAMTPTPQPTACPAYEVFTPDNNMYLAKSPGGNVSIERIAQEEIEESSQEQSTSAKVIPGQPSTSTGLRTLQTKAKNKDTRARASSASSIYPQSKEDRSKARSKSRPRDEVEEPKKDMPKRGPNGRFIKS